MSGPVGPVLYLGPYSGPSSLSMQQKVLVQHLGTDIDSSYPHKGVKEHIVSVHVPPMTGTTLSRNPGILTFGGNPASHVRADDNGNISAILIG